MTRKHFTELAKIMQEAQDYMTNTARHKVANRIADYCQTQNHLFDRERFLTACELENEKCTLCIASRFETCPQHSEDKNNRKLKEH